MYKSVWISYDLGVKGDYPSLYAWLDNHKAKECGDSVAYLKYELSQDEKLAEKLKKELASCVNFAKTDRVYIIFKIEDGTTKGQFIFGKRKASPWEGYGDALTEDDL
ncbi:MAG: hypothetical protein JSS37_11575 [Proteobacteria bacterium]|nr:hypothetical protein [Pseudomonadota bacterium]